MFDNATDEPVDVGTLTLQQLEDGICTFAGHLAAATCRWLVLIGEYDRREGWASWGTRSAAHWLSWRCGMSGGTAREHIRVGRALLDLPVMRAAFGEGRLTYSKVRALTRIATPALEAELVELGLSLPAAHVERVVRGYRRSLRLEAPPPEPRAASLSRWWGDDGYLTVRLTLAPDDGVHLVAALEAYAAALGAEAAEGSTESAGRAPAASADDGVSESPALGTAADAPAKNSELGSAAAGGCVTDDPAWTASIGDEAEAFLAMVAAAMAQAPVDRSGSDRFEVVLHADIEQLHALAQEPDPSAVDVDVTKDDRGPPVDTVAAGRPTPRGAVRPAESPNLRRGRCHFAAGPAASPHTLRRLACDARLRLMTHSREGSPLDVGRRQRLVTPGLRRLLEERDNGRCQFPACRRRRRLHAHHVRHWADGGLTDLANLVLLCRFHHAHVHEHGFTVHASAVGGFTFARPDGTWMDPAPPSSGHSRLDMLPTALHRSPPVTADTTTPQWWGDPLHLFDVVDVLLRMRDRAAASHAAASAAPASAAPAFTGSPTPASSASAGTTPW